MTTDGAVKTSVPHPAPRRPSRIREVFSFLGVGGTGYVVDVAVFNAALALAGGPWIPRCLGVLAAMVVTYVGNRTITWRGSAGDARRREVALFVLFNLVGLAISLACLGVSHVALGLTSRVADNVSANGVGLALGTAFRYWAYRRFVFRPPAVELRPGRPTRRTDVI